MILVANYFKMVATGMSREVENLIKENNELLFTKYVEKFSSAE